MRTVRIALATAGIPALLVATCASAAAHVTVNPGSAPGGGYAKLTFRVPTESGSSTTKVQVFLPTDHPLASVSVQPHPGWTYQIKKAKLAKPLADDDGNRITQAVSEVDWTADSAASAIGPGEFDEFSIAAGPLPKSGTMTFKALQTYADGSVERWIETGASAETPAPTLTLTSATDAAAASAPTAAEPREESRTPLVLSIIALVAAVAGAGLALLRRRS